MNGFITFAEPFWFVVEAFVLVLLVVFFNRMQQRRQQELARFASSHLLGKLCASVSGRRRTIKRIVLLFAIACCFAALARPQYGVKWVDVKRKGIDILFAIDTSKSMLAEDVRPNRLQRAKYGVLDFIGQLEGDRVGLMPFAGSAFLMCPMTIDYSAFESSLHALDTAIIPKGGTDLAAVIAEAEAVLSNEANHKILVLITDGENLEGDVMRAAKRAAEKGMTIYTVGVGTSEGELIPLTRNGKTGFVKDASGTFITSHLDEKSLTEIAEATAGLYVPLGTSGEGLQAIYQQKLSLIPKEELAEKRHKVPLERFTWPLGAAIALLIVEFLIGGRKSKRSLRIPFVKTAGRRKKKAMAVALFCCLLPLSNNARASVGEDAYHADDFLTASMFYSEQLELSPTDARLHYNYGTAAYKNNLFEDAAQSFSEALKSNDLNLQELAYYNRGNALFQQGMESLQTDKQHTLELWQQAVDSFDGALQLDSTNDDANFNLTLVKKKLEELQKEQKEEEKQKKEEEKKKDQEQNKDNKEQEKKQNNDGDQQQEQNQDTEQDQQNKENGDQQKDGDKNNNQSAEPSEQEQGENQAAAQAEDDATKSAADQQAQQDQKLDQERRQQGKMTTDEAEQLLNSLKDEEGELNFVPVAPSGSRDNQQTTKDW
jgi:Ca-activated chloride channel homolog